MKIFSFSRNYSLKKFSRLFIIGVLFVGILGLLYSQQVQAQEKKAISSAEILPTMAPEIAIMPISYEGEVSEGNMGAIEPAIGGIASPDIRIMPPVDPQGSLFVSQKHATSVLFRGNGDSFVQTRIAFTNIGTEDMEMISFEMPTEDVRNLSVLQEIRKPQCIEYDYTSGARCIKFEDNPNYYNEWGEATFVFPEFTLEGNTLSIMLDEMTPQYASGAVVIFFNSSEFVSKSLGSYSYKFETIRSLDSTIEDSRVGISVENNFTLRDGDSEIDYATQYSESAMLSSVAEKDVAGLQSLSSQIQNLGYGQIVEYIEYLDKGESYMVKGAYAKSWFALYVWRVVGVIVAVVALVFLLSLFKKMRNSAKNEAMQIQKTSVTSSLFEVKNHVYALVALALFTGVMVVIHLVTKSSVIGYGMYGGGYGVGMLPAGFMAFIFGLAGLLALFSTPLLIFADRGWRSSIPVIILELVWAMIVLLLYALII